MKTAALTLVAALCLAAPRARAAEAKTHSKDLLAKVAAANDKAKAENVLIEKANALLAKKDWAGAVAALDPLIAAAPERWQYRSTLGLAKLNLGAYEEAIAAYETARSATPAPSGDELGNMLANEGNSYLKLGKTAEAMKFYADAAKHSKKPATAYFNLCAVAYNQGLMADAARWCDKAIAADPKKADAYFIKGSAMYGDGKLDANNKYVVPAGTVEALGKYLELAPEGGHAGDVKAMLDALGQPIQTSFGRKKK